MLKSMARAVAEEQIVSEETREVRVQRALEAMRALTEAIYSKNPSEEELLELEKALDRKA